MGGFKIEKFKKLSVVFLVIGVIVTAVVLSSCSMLSAVMGQQPTPVTVQPAPTITATRLQVNAPYDINGTWEISYDTGYKDVLEIAQLGPYLTVLTPDDPFPLSSGFVNGNLVMITEEGTGLTNGVVLYGTISNNGKNIHGTVYPIYIFQTY